MSRLAKNPIQIPEKVTVVVSDDMVTVEGPKGKLERRMHDDVAIEVKDGAVVLAPANETVFARSLWGTYASHVRNMIAGVTEGFTKKLILEGVGFKTNLVGQNLEMALGFSHPVIMPVPEGIDMTVEKNTMTISGIDKELVGAFAAKIRSKKKPEPYKGKGIRYIDEVIRRKQGKKSV